MQKQPGFKFVAFGFMAAFAVLTIGCSPAKQPAAPEADLAAQSTAPRIYVTNEVSGDLTVIDSASAKVIATIPLGKRPRGIHPSPDGKTLYVALSGSPIAGPGVDETTLPPPDKSADGIGVFDVAQNKLVKIIPGGSDPENFDVSKDGKLRRRSASWTSAVRRYSRASRLVANRKA